MTENPDIEPAKGDDGLTDDERRLAKQKKRDAEQAEIDRAGDAERAKQERANGEPEGSRGRNAEPGGAEEEPDPPKRATGRASSSTRTDK